MADAYSVEIPEVVPYPTHLQMVECPVEDHLGCQPDVEKAPVGDVGWGVSIMVFTAFFLL
jgi:hypothetical protein